MEERAQRIVETAVELAEQGGFEAVRLRDVASHSGVALGTLYRRFSSKEDLLVAALEVETLELERRFVLRQPTGESALERVMSFFAQATRGMTRRPNLARALLKAASSGEPQLAQKVGSYHAQMERMIVMSLRGEVMGEAGELPDPNPSVEEARIAETLDLIWFALMVGWSGGVHGQGAVIEKMTDSARIFLRGAGRA